MPIMQAMASHEESKEGRMKGDRFEQMVEDTFGPTQTLLRGEAIALLRKEHAAVRRLVKKQADICGHSGPHNDSGNCVGYSRACSDILAALDKMAKGERK